MSKISNTPISRLRFAKSKLAIAAAAACAIPQVSLAQGALEEIVVTATKRAQTLQEIPVAVSVTSSETIEKSQIQDIADLQSVVPSLRVAQQRSSAQTNFTIRGFGNGANNPGIEPSVGVFIDGVYRSRSSASISDLPKLERVEVLRGPQSTLFGKNASAGVISVVTAKPSGEREGKLSLSYGNYDALVAKAYYEDAITDNVAFSISASHNERDGYATGTVTGSDVNSRDRQAYRGQLLITPSDATEIRFIADYDTIEEVCCTTVNVVAGNPATLILNALGGPNVIDPDNPSSLLATLNQDPLNKIDNSGVSMHIEHDFGNFALTSITSYRNTDSQFSVDVDFSTADILNQNVDTEIDTFSQEFRLTSTAGDAVDWMVGAYFFDETIENQDELPYGTQFRAYADALSRGGVSGLEQGLGFPAGTFFAAGDITQEQSTLDNQAYSIFGSVDWHISDRLTATVGLNYTKDEKEVSVRQTMSDPFSALDLPQIAQVTGNPALLGLRPLQFFPPFLDFPNAVENGETDDDELTYSVRLAYDVNDSVNLYGAVSTGFKASSWDLNRSSRPVAADIPALQAAGLATTNLIPGTRFAAPEEAEVFELGLKARFDWGALNVAIFDQSIENFQSNVFQGTGFVLANAGEQSTTGIEFDLVYFPTENLKIDVAGTFLDPEFDSFTQAGRDPQTGETVDISGQTPADINEVSLSIGATYSFPIGSNEGFIRGDFQYEDAVRVRDLEIQDVTRETEILNLAAGLTTQNGLNVTLWARNLTDHDTLTSAFPGVAQPGIFGGYRNAPRTYGVTLTKDF